MVIICANRALLREWLRDQSVVAQEPQTLERTVDEALTAVEEIAKAREGTNYRLVETFSTWIGARHGSSRFPVYLAHIQDVDRETLTCQLIVEAFLGSLTGRSAYDPKCGLAIAAGQAPSGYEAYGS